MNSIFILQLLQSELIDMSGKRMGLLLAARASAAMIETFLPNTNGVCRLKTIASSHRHLLPSNVSSYTFVGPASSFHTSARDFPREKQEEKVRKVPAKQLYTPVDLETSKKYLKSEAFALSYEGLPIWHPSLYR